jgi:hypothetical protein
MKFVFVNPFPPLLLSSRESLALEMVEQRNLEKSA